MSTEAPTTTVSECQPARPRGVHTPHYLKNMIREGKLHRDKYWATEPNGEQSIRVAMPESSVDLRITRQSPADTEYRLALDADKRDVANKAAYETVARTLAGLHQAAYGAQGHTQFSAKDLGRAVEIIALLPCNLQVAGRSV